MLQPDRWSKWLVAGLVVGLVVGLMPTVSTAQEAETPQDFGEVIEVRTGFVRVTLPAGVSPPGPEAFEVRWNGRPQRVLRVVGGAADPLELAIAVDRSASFHHAFAPLRAAALALVDQGVSAQDRVFAVAFSDQARLLAEGRGEAAKVLAALPVEPEPGSHPTALHESLARTLQLFENADARAALIVASDGCDTAGGLTSATSLARRARQLAIPVFLLMPDRNPCQNTRCRRDVAGEWQCTPDDAPAIVRGESNDMFNPAAGVSAMLSSSAASGATAERDRFIGLISDAEGGAFVVRKPGEWDKAMERIFERLSRQWTVVFEPESEAVDSADVRVWAHLAGRRKRLR